ncbi:hypothetical protein NDU88_005589 [Pleurodeles waltl]|uniref:Uncharacterized protein n=1 Tax=Pleurodeles waltl TaxID=8319 RepID=A0AAV7RKL6_PLEWA|nr:hypothetical protein NDU88_005589 [Pleurodeles waltl]
MIIDGGRDKPETKSEPRRSQGPAGAAQIADIARAVRLGLGASREWSGGSAVTLLSLQQRPESSSGATRSYMRQRLALGEQHGGDPGGACRLPVAPEEQQDQAVGPSEGKGSRLRCGLYRKSIP